MFLGLAWWLLWIPVTVACGFDAVAYPPSLTVSIVIGLAGLVISLPLVAKLVRTEWPWAQKWTRVLTGDSLTAAYRALEEIAQTEED